MLIIITTIFLIQNTMVIGHTTPGTLFIMRVSCYKEKVSKCALHHYRMKSMDLHIKFENIAQIAPVIRPATFDIVLLCNEQNYTMMKLNVKSSKIAQINVKLQNCTDNFEIAHR